MKNLIKILSMFLVILLFINACDPPTGEPSKRIPMKATAAATQLSAKLILVSQWESSGEQFAQINGLISNNSSMAISAWTIICDAFGSSLEQGWNGNYTIKNNQIIVTNLDYNGSINAKGTTEFGFIIKGFVQSKFDSINKNVVITGISSKDGESNDQTGSVTDSKKRDTTSTSVDKTTSAALPAPAGKQKVSDWLSVKGNTIVDSNGKQVWITGINWFGYNTGTNTFDGLWAANLDKSIASIANHGFNLIRIPFSVELIKNWQSGKYPKANYNAALNPKLKNLNSLEIFDRVVRLCRNNGIKIMIDIHSAKSDPMGHMEELWYQDKITVNDYYSALAWMAKRYKNDDTIIAYDLKNEPHGQAKWDNSKDRNNWKYVAQTAALKVLKQNPNVLIMVEGIENYNGKYAWWGGNLRGVKKYPVNLGKYQNKLVYSPHDYGPAVYAQSWFKKGYTYKSLYKDYWHDTWLYIHEDKIAPLLIGEWGGYMTEPNLTWMTHMRTLIKKYKLHHTFWCYNANSGDTGGLVKDDFTSWDTKKYNFVKSVLWQKDGKFVGLDAEIPLGAKGSKSRICQN